MCADFGDPSALGGWDPDVELGFPGTFPFTRGIQPTMYRGRLWTMRQYAGFGTASESNRRYRYLLSQGVTGLSVAFDLPTQMGYDSDHPLAEGEVGRVGVAVDSLEDMVELFEGIPLERVSTSMTINSTAIVLLALYVAVARSRGVPDDMLAGTVQNDVLKEYVARGTYIYPPRPSLRIVTDIFAFCERTLPNWNSISISGYHIREAGATAVQEVAFTFANAIAYVEAAKNGRPRRQQLRAAHLLLLQRSQRFLRGDREVPRGTAPVGAADARAVRRHEPSGPAAALSYADRRQHADRPAAGQQHRPRRHPGAGGGTRRNPVAPLQRAGRSAGAADGGVCPHRVTDATDPGVGVWGHEHRRSRWPAPTRSRR